MYGDQNVGYTCGGVDTRYLVLAIPIAFAFIILRYKTFRAAHPLFLAVFVLASSGLQADSGVWLHQQLSARPPMEPLLEVFVPVFVPTLITGIFWSTQTTWRGWFGRLFQANKLISKGNDPTHHSNAAQAGRIRPAGDQAQPS